MQVQKLLLPSTEVSFATGKADLFFAVILKKE
jgi:hypothetical protein